MNTVSVVTLIVLLLGMVAVTYIFSAQIGSKASVFWAYLLLYSIGLDLFFVQTFKIYWKNIVLISSLRAEVPRICDLMRKKVRFMMSHNTGMMRGSLALAQHFSPACRVARMYPALPVCRFLLSVNDSDLPLRRRVPNDTDPFEQRLAHYFQLVLDGFCELSPTTQNMTLEFVLMGLLIFISFVLFEIGTVSPAAGWVVFALLLMSPVLIEARFSLLAYLHSLERKEMNDFSFITKKGDIRMKPEKRNPPDILSLASALDENKYDVDERGAEEEDFETAEDRISIELLDKMIASRNQSQSPASPQPSSKSGRSFMEQKSPSGSERGALVTSFTPPKDSPKESFEEQCIDQELRMADLQLDDVEEEADKIIESVGLVPSVPSPIAAVDGSNEESDLEDFSNDDFEMEPSPTPKVGNFADHSTHVSRNNVVNNSRFDDESTVSSLGSQSALWQPQQMAAGFKLEAVDNDQTNNQLNLSSGPYNTLSNIFKHVKSKTSSIVLAEQYPDLDIYSNADLDDDNEVESVRNDGLLITITKDLQRKERSDNALNTFMFWDDMERSVRSLPAWAPSQEAPARRPDASGVPMKSLLPWDTAAGTMLSDDDGRHYPLGGLAKDRQIVSPPVSERPQTSHEEMRDMRSPDSGPIAADQRPFTSPGLVGNLGGLDDFDVDGDGEGDDALSVLDEDKRILQETVRSITEQKKLRKAAELKAARAASFKYRKYAGRQRQRQATLTQQSEEQVAEAAAVTAVGPGNDAKELSVQIRQRKHLLRNLLTVPQEAPVPLVVDFLGAGQVLTVSELEWAKSTPLRLKPPVQSQLPQLSPRDEPPPPPRLENSKGPARILFSDEFSLAEMAHAKREKHPMLSAMRTEDIPSQHSREQT